MKKLQFLFLFLLTFLFLQDANAQWSVTPSIGVNNAKSTFISCKPISRINYFMIGIAPKYKFDKKNAAELGIQFSQKGFGAGIIIPAAKIQYLDLLPTFEYNLLRNLSLYSGLNVGFRLSELYASDNKNWKKNRTVENVYRSVDLGAIIGFRVKYKNYQLGFHFNQGLMNASTIQYNDANGNVLNQEKEFHQNFQLSLGYQINVKHK